MRRLLMMSIFSCVSLSTTAETSDLSLMLSFWSSKSFSSRARRSRSLVFHSKRLPSTASAPMKFMISRRKSSLRFSGISIFSSIVRILVLAGVAVLHALLEGEGLDVVDVVRGQLGDRVLVGADGALDLVLDDLLVLALDHADDLAEALAHLLARDE